MMIYVLVKNKKDAEQGRMFKDLRLRLPFGLHSDLGFEYHREEIKKLFSENIAKNKIAKKLDIYCSTICNFVRIYP